MFFGRRFAAEFGLGRIISDWRAVLIVSEN